jgi:hypothetical protein
MKNDDNIKRRVESTIVAVKVLERGMSDLATAADGVSVASAGLQGSLSEIPPTAWLPTLSEAGQAQRRRVLEILARQGKT